MSRKVMVVACAVVLLMAMGASAQNWTNGTGDGKWNTAGNWAEGAVPVMVPDETGWARVGGLGGVCVLDGTQAQGISQWCMIGSGDGDGVLSIEAGGLLGTPAWGPGETFVGWDESAGVGGNGILNIDGTGSIGRSESWKVGSPEHTGVVNITNGGQMVGVWWGNFIRSTGTINVISGTMTILGEGDFVIDAGGLIDISGTSTLTLDGDRKALIDGYIASGAIKGNGVLGGAVATLVGTTTVVSVIPEPATLVLLGLGGLFLRRKNA